MKILVVCQNYFPEQFRINDICKSLAQKGEDVTVLTGLPNYPTGKIEKSYRWFRKRKETIDGVKVIRTWEIARRKGTIFRMLNYFSYAFSASIKALFLKKDFDAIYVYQLSPVLMAIPGIIYKKKNKKKLILYCLDLWPESLKAGGISEQSKIYKIFDKISNKIYNYADEIVVTSKSFIENMNKKVNKNIKISYLPQYAEEILKLKPNKKFSKELNLVFAGNIGKAQSVETIIKAAEIIEKEEKNIKIHIVGNGSEYENCKKQAEGISNIKFYGNKPITEMQYYYDMADAMLVTLSNEYFSCSTLPGKVQACMKTGNPIIAAANGETAMIINDAKCGYCVEAENEKQLAEAIIKFYNLSEEEKKNLNENSVNYYNKNFRKEIFIDKLLNILKRKEDKNV